MGTLLASVIEAHDSAGRWQDFERVEATIVSQGDLWGIKGLPQDATPRRMSVWLHEQRASVEPFGDPDWHAAFTSERVAIERSDGTVVQERSTSRSSFDGHNFETPWDPLHRAYFNGYAMWNYLTMPFLLAAPGVTVQEIAPWQEGGETWRVLRASFPPSLATHSTSQDFYFGRDLLLRRHDYDVDVAGGFGAAQLVHDYIEGDGIRLPSKRRAYLRDATRQTVRESLMVSIDISDVHFS
ncbi:hypothetical protein [Methylobacterium oxalidis]|uniref:Uncharacterized protein n=1 Tax=Methylobacterium oxalidis TaxID=944322 RepID=A0A512JBA2_9HYPH|nr:hypothetical protein [Methylobacterium oxalidis]GEP07258.1 hypothetical protein MOX02_52960 [Methylobacterium oxalidis]GJE32591.1 hypothetical protein LDDCCGHA_2779 [Methylobacterium oxalidis]GLS63806.1 hypothetical protein GCM10007888_21870 [Methylobacterium oxalidis]